MIRITSQSGILLLLVSESGEGVLPTPRCGKRGRQPAGRRRVHQATKGPHTSTHDRPREATQDSACLPGFRLSKPFAWSTLPPVKRVTSATCGAVWHGRKG
jgi:hypothetical protein